MSKYTSAQLAKGYLKLKAQIAEIEGRHKEELAEPKETLKELEQLLAGALHEEGIKSVNTDAGTVGWKTTKVFKMADPVTTREFALENDWTDLLKLDLSSAGVKAYLEANGELPPGVIELDIESLYHRAKK